MSCTLKCQGQNKKERGICSRSKKTKEIGQLNTMYDPGMDHGPRQKQSFHFYFISFFYKGC